MSVNDSQSRFDFERLNEFFQIFVCLDNCFIDKKMALYYFESKITHTFSMEQDLNEGVLIDFRLFLI
jgi:hypothetical protein